MNKNMTDKLVNELYETSDKYFGRIAELLILAADTINRCNNEIERLNMIINKENYNG